MKKFFFTFTLDSFLMKKYVVFIWLLLWNTTGFAQNSLTLPIKNNPLPSDTLRILMIGNSFTVDVTEYIGDIVRNSGIDEKTCCLYRVTQDGSSLQTWRDKYKNNDQVQLEKKAGLLTMDITQGTLQDILRQHWDVISLQQVSVNSYKINTFSPFLDDLLSYINQDCLNKQVAICWHLTWSCWEGHKVLGLQELEGWSNMVSTVDQMIEKYGIDIIIPSGTAIQNARSTELNTEKSLTRDGYHMDEGIGRYIIACTLFESLFTPVYGISIYENRFSGSFLSKELYFGKSCAIGAVNDFHSIMNTDTLQYSEPQLIVSPSLSDGIVTLQNRNFSGAAVYTHIQLFDTTGRKVFETKELLAQKITFDFSDLQPRLYILSVTYDGEKETFPIIIR